jgi:energy-coupling factor transporter ATP-binding protein EcfA2
VKESFLTKGSCNDPTKLKELQSLKERFSGSLSEFEQKLLNFVLNPKPKFVFVGRTGVGKTTFINASSCLRPQWRQSLSHTVCVRGRGGGSETRRWRDGEVKKKRWVGIGETAGGEEAKWHVARRQARRRDGETRDGKFASQIDPSLEIC